MIDSSDLFWGGVFPGVVAAALFTLDWQATHRAASAWRTALVAGYLAGHWALGARTVGLVPAIAKCVRPSEAHNWLPLVLLLAILPDAVACIGRRGPVLGGLLRVALCVFVPWRLLHGSKYMPLALEGDFGGDFGFDFGGWSTGEMTAWLGGIAAVLLISWQWIRQVDIDVEIDQAVGARAVLATVVACGAAITAALADSLIYGQLLGVLSGAIAGCGIAALLLKTERGPDAAAGPLVVALGSLLVVAHFFSGLKIAHGVLLISAMALAVGWQPLPAAWSAQRQAAVRAVLCLALMGFAVASAGFDFAAEQAEPTGNPYGEFSQ